MLQQTNDDSLKAELAFNMVGVISSQALFPTLLVFHICLEINNCWLRGFMSRASEQSKRNMVKREIKSNWRFKKKKKTQVPFPEMPSIFSCSQHSLTVCSIHHDWLYSKSCLLSLQYFSPCLFYCPEAKVDANVMFVYSSVIKMSQTFGQILLNFADSNHWMHSSNWQTFGIDTIQDDYQRQLN